MPLQYYVDGPALIKVDTGANHTLEELGYTRDGAEIRFEANFEEIKSDDMGGEQGPPGDLNYLGERAIVRLELTKWDKQIADKLTPRLYGGTAGTVGSPGTLLLTDSKSFRLLIQPAENPLNFPKAILTGAIEVNKGTRHSRLVLEFTCLKDSSNNKLYDTTTS